MSEFFIVASTAQAAIIVVQDIIFSESEEREEGQNYNNAFVTTMRNLVSADFRKHFRISKGNFARLIIWLGEKFNLSRKPINFLEIKLMAVLWLLATPECYR